MLIIGAGRTPFTPTHGALSGWHPVALAAHVLSETVAAAGIAPAAIDCVVAGCAVPVGAQGGNIARAAALQADLPPSVAAFTVDAGEAASHQALHVGLAKVAAGQAQVVAVLGIEVASLVPAGASALNRNYGPAWGPAIDRYAEAGGLVPEGVALDQLAAQHGFTGGALLAHAERARSRAAQTSARFVVATPASADGKAAAPPRAAVVADQPVPLKIDSPPLFADDGTTTAATLAPTADGAAVVLLVSDEVSDQLVDPPLARVGATATTGAAPTSMFAAVPSLVQGLHAHHRADVTVLDTAGAAAEMVVESVGFEVNPLGGNLGRGRPVGAAGLAAVIEAIESLEPNGGSAVVISSTTDGQAVGTRLAVVPTT